MELLNTPALETERLILRKFCIDDIAALFAIYSDKEVNTYLPWFPLSTVDEAERLFETEYARAYEQPCGYRWAVCLKENGVPIGYVHLSTDEAHDLGYGLLKRFWRMGIATEAARVAVEQAKKDGVPYITATHDIKNPRSGGVMKALGMRYQYTYREQWQPKNIPVDFRLYQLNLDGNEDRVYRKYWERYPVHYVETI